MRLKYILLTLLMALTIEANAKLEPVPKMYMFGLAASFTDTIVHITGVQELDSVWIDTKNNFVISRENYSYQLRDYLEQKSNMAHRTCIVVFNKNRKKLEKKYQKMMRLYTQPKKGAQQYDVRFLSDQDFHFKTIDETVYYEEEVPQIKEVKPDKKEKKKKHGK